MLDRSEMMQDSIAGMIMDGIPKIEAIRYAMTAHEMAVALIEILKIEPSFYEMNHVVMCLSRCVILGTEYEREKHGKI